LVKGEVVDGRRATERVFSGVGIMIVFASAGTIGAMKRFAPVVLGALVVLAGGCPDEPIPSEEGSSTGGSTGPGPDPDSGSTLGGTSSEGPSDATESTSTADTTTTDDSTTGVESRGQARFVVRQPVEGDDDEELVLFEYADGELSPPLSLTPGLPAGSGVSSTAYADSGRALAYCTDDPAMMERPCFAIDLTTDPPGLSQALVAGPVPADVYLYTPSWIEATETFAFATRDLAGIVPDAIYAAAFAGGALQLPELVAEAGPGESIDANVRIRPDGAWVGYVSIPDVGPQNAFIAPLDAPDPSAAVMVSDLVDPELEARTVIFVPGHEAVIYPIDSSLPGPTDASLWFVDISGPMPGTPIRIDDPLTGAEVRGPQIAPDGHALVYWVDTGSAGDLMLVDLSLGVPQPPVLVSTLGAGQTSFIDFGWSPDSRLIVYLAAHEQPDTYDIHVVQAPGSTPGEPMLATGGLIPEGEILVLTFDASSSWLYYIGEQDDEIDQLYRVDVSGAEPGTPQRVSGRNGWLPGEIIPSPDWSMVLYTVEPLAPNGRELYLVDVSGSEPGEAIRINAPLAADVDVAYSADFSRDGSVVLYGERGPTDRDPTPIRLVDLASLDVLLVSDDASGAVPIVD
jgi:hypothetical protein